MREVLDELLTVWRAGGTAGVATVVRTIDSAPRPPGAIPRGNQPQPDDEEEVPELPQGRVLPAPNRPLPGQGIPPPGSVTKPKK